MTRENKLALVVGFGLLLTVGILISDHFSKARDQRYADQRDTPHILDPLHGAGRSTGGYVVLGGDDENPPRPVQPSASASGTLDRSAAAKPVGDQSGDPGASGRMGREATAGPPMGDDDASAPERIVLGGDDRSRPGSSAGTDRYLVHEVLRNESLTSISRDYFGSPEMVRTIAALNDLADPDELRAGMRLRIPRPETAGRVDDRPRAENQRPAPSARPKTYTVRKGDTLSEIAQSQLGSSKYWRRLYEHNRERIPNPDRVIEGTVLEIPPLEAGSRR